ncbi:hypothetical protein Tco_0137322 [Tanacetum coccineum]
MEHFFCGLSAVIQTSWTAVNPRRRFYGCPHVEGGWIFSSARPTNVLTSNDDNFRLAKDKKQIGRKSNIIRWCKYKIEEVVDC